MCGIFAILNLPHGVTQHRARALKCAKRLRHRGPDGTGIFCQGNNILVHERLSIVDPEGGSQPLFKDDGSLVLVVNGEIYNHQELRESLKGEHQFRTKSDCEVLLFLYEEHGERFVELLNGIFALVLLDLKRDIAIVARDHIGIVPLYMGWGVDGSLWVSSELKAIADQVLKFEEFPPGHRYSTLSRSRSRWYKPSWFDAHYLPTQGVDLPTLRRLLEAAVARQMMSDVPFGVLLSGGLDSSLITAIAARHFEASCKDNDEKKHKALHSFSIGLQGSPDLKAAKSVAQFLGTHHHEFVFTVEEGLDALHDVIYHLETFDVTTVRASTPMYLMARKIKSLGFKMVLSGEGSDEVFGGYLYFHKAPNKEEFHKETVNKVKALHSYDCLRANKSTAAWGLEVRVPFLDIEFLSYAMDIDPQDKMITKERMEKWLLREAFKGYLPDEILWRQKEQFSDGVGYSWIDSLKATASERVSDEEFAKVKYRFPEDPPATKEAYYYRCIFDSFYPQPSALACIPRGPSIACSTAAAIAWDETFKKLTDPSGRSVIGVHQSTATKLND